jgi:hypothetical protein
VVGVFVDYDLVAIPEPVSAITEVKGSDAEVEAAKPETVGTASGDVPHVAAAEAAGEVAMLPGVVEVEAGVIRSPVVTDPGAVVVDVRGFRMAGLIVETGSRVGDCPVRRCSWRAMFRDISATDSVAATGGAVLRQSGKGKEQGCSKQGNEYDKGIGDSSH